MSTKVFIRYGSEIQMVEADRRQRKPRSAAYRDAWNLIPQWAAHGETRGEEHLSKSGEPSSKDKVIPSQAWTPVHLVAGKV